MNRSVKSTRLNNVTTQNTSGSNDTNLMNDKVADDKFAIHNDDNRINIVLSYLGHESHIYSRKLTRLLRKVKINVRIAFKKNKTIGDHFSSNMKGEKMNKSGVVYKINCAGCEKIYIGQTSKTAEERIKQHMDNIGKNHSAYSNLVNHHRTTNHNFLFKEVAIIAQDNNDKKREIKETLLTKKFNNITINDISFNTCIF